MDEITLKLNSPITEEQWDAITDVDFDNTDRIWFSTKHGKEVEFVKVVRCKDCKWFKKEPGWNCTEYTICGISPTYHPIRREEDFCSRAERRTE